MLTINLEVAGQKGRKLTEFLRFTSHFGADDGLASYHAAQAIKSANLRAGLERRCAAVKKAVKQFNVMVSMAENERGVRTVRLYSPTKQTEIYL